MDKETKSEYERTYRDKKKALGLCVQGCGRYARADKTRCAWCEKEHQKYKKDWQRNQSALAKVVRKPKTVPMSQLLGNLI